MGEGCATYPAARQPREILLHDREHIVLVAAGLACGVDADALGCLKPSAYLLNAARGRVVDQPALADALARRQIRGAALDVMVDERCPRPRRCGPWSTCSSRRDQILGFRRQHVTSAFTM
jgi:D-isomer specific 2-hydroxyacid dehydrogenase, NAD binding domain